MDFSIIIINYNLTEEIRVCINSLIENSDNIKFEVILIDNNSQDFSIQNLCKSFSQRLKDRFIFIQSEENIGFGRACNLAAKQSRGKILCFINPDTVFNNNIFAKLLDNDIFNELSEGNAIVGINVSQNRFADFSAGFFPNMLLETMNIVLLGRFLEAFLVLLLSKISIKKKIKVHWVMGAALFVSKSSFKAVGGFDQDYFLYFEEMDLCKRIIDKSGKVIYLPDIKLEHIGSASSKKNYQYFTKMFYKGKLLFINKHYTGLKYYLLKKLMIIHFFVQKLLWSSLKYVNKEKALDKLKAFNELIKNINTPHKLSNKNLPQ